MCGKSFSSKQRLTYHTERKVCQKHVYRCQSCGLTFTTNYRLQYHTIHNVCQKKTKLFVKQKQKQQNTSDINFYKNLSKDELIIKLIQSETESRVLKEHPQTVNNIHIIMNFGELNNPEQIEEINSKCPHLLDNVIHQHLLNSIPYLTKQIHCNMDVFPQYSNIFIESYRNPYIMVYIDGQFRRQPKKQTINNLIDEFIQMMGNHVDNTIIDDKLIKKYENYRDSVDIDGNRRKELEDELIGILLDQGEKLKLDNNFKLILQNHIKCAH